MSQQIYVPKAKPLGVWVMLAAVWMIVVSFAAWGIFQAAYGLRNTILQAPLPSQIALGYTIVKTALLFVFMPVWLLKLMTDRSRRFPGIYVAWTISALALYLIGALISYLAYRPLYESGQMQVLHPEAVRTALQYLAAIVIWAPYMLRSRHVRETFVS